MKIRSFFIPALTLILILNIAPLHAQEDGLDLLTSVKISKQDIQSSLEALKKENKISEADFQKAQKELMAMSDSQVTALNQTAIGIIKNNPDGAVGLTKTDKIDTKEVQKQIESLSRPE